MSEASLKEQLMLLKATTIRTGAVHEAQVLQLKMWPLLIPNVTSVEVSVDTDRKMVSFKCSASKFKTTKKLKLLCQNIGDWTKQLLWPETTTLIRINDAQVFDSRSK